MVGLNLGNLLKQQQQPAGLEPSDPWDKDKVKNPERFSDLHRIICEKVIFVDAAKLKSAY